VIVAGRRIGHLNFGRHNDPVLVVLRLALRDARRVRAEFKLKVP
jgi:hypothetical protein